MSNSDSSGVVGSCSFAAVVVSAAASDNHCIDSSAEAKHSVVVCSRQNFAMRYLQVIPCRVVRPNHIDHSAYYEQN